MSIDTEEKITEDRLIAIPLLESLTPSSHHWNVDRCSYFLNLSMGSRFQVAEFSGPSRNTEHPGEMASSASLTKNLTDYRSLEHPVAVAGVFGTSQRTHGL